MLSTVQLRRADAAQREPQALLLGGGDPAAWLAEVARWPVDAETLRFFPLAEPGGVDVAGVLVVWPRETPGLDVSELRGLPFGRIDAELDFFAPLDARLSPPMSVEELRVATRFPVMVFHPALGLTGFENSEGARVTHWLAAPLAAAEDWSAARAGAPALPGLRSLQLIAELSLDQLFGEESKDIGSQADQTPPPAPDEKKPNPVKDALLGGGAFLASRILELTSLLPHTASSPTWINSVENWLSGKLTNRHADLEREREKELHRLLHLLKTNPELGLKFALPLAALMNRGRAAPGSRLGQRPTDFSLGRLGGGGAVDHWNLSEQMRASLAQSYREQAMRELRLGRARRAAYIFAELLGDLSAAAGALKQGKHFLEAAVLYRDRLHNPLAAAECFALGGQFTTALALYEKQECWIQAADLQAKLGDREGEVRSVRRAVAVHVKNHDVISAARLIDGRLAETDEALALLASTWPAGRQAIPCLEERFVILRRMQRDATAEELVHELTAHATPTPQLAPLANVLAKLAENGDTPPPLRRLAAEAVRVKASAALSERKVDSSDELAVLRALTRLVPGDKLFTRDTLRFRAARQKTPPPELKTAPKHAVIPRLKVTLAKTFGGPAPTKVHAVQTVGDGYVMACSSHPNQLAIQHGNWSGVLRGFSWTSETERRHDQVHLAVVPGMGIVVPDSGVAERVADFPASSVLKSPEKVGTPAWIPRDLLGVAALGNAVWLVRCASSSRILLEGYHNEKLISSQDFTEVFQQATKRDTDVVLPPHPRLAVQAGGGVAITVGSRLVCFGSATKPAQDEFEFTRDDLLEPAPAKEARVHELDVDAINVLPAPATRPGWLVSLTRGLVFVALDGSASVELDGDLESPVVAVLRLGEIVSIGGTRGMVFRLHPDRVEIVGTFDLPKPVDTALLATNELNEFATFSSGQPIQRWRISN